VGLPVSVLIGPISMAGPLGDRSSFCPRKPAHSEQLMFGRAGSRGLELDGHGHAPKVDDPTTLIMAVRAFLDEARATTEIAGPA